MIRFVFAILFILSISGFVFSQNCKDADRERAESIAQKFESSNMLRFSIENGRFGNCFHYIWMDEMRKFGIRQVTATVKFVWKDKIEKLKIKQISFWQDYYEYDSEIKDKKLLEQIENSGLKNRLEEIILERAGKSVPDLISSLKDDYKRGLFPKEPKGKISGTMDESLLDDEVLPILNFMPTVNF